MQMPISGHDFELTVAPDRRDFRQPSERLIGRLTSCDGTRATISTSASDVSGAASDFWSIGRLISINTGQARIVGLVYAMRTASSEWDAEAANTIQVDVELVGEINEDESGKTVFHRGITSYPFLGAVAHRIRASDLQAVHDLGGRGGVTIGTLSQDDDIAATVCVEDMLRRHFAVVGTTGVGKSSAVSLLVRKAVEERPNLRVLILDPHNEYARAFPSHSLTLDANSLELPFWMFRFDELADVVFRGRRDLDEEADILRDLIPSARGRFSVIQAPVASSTLLKKPLDSGRFTADTPTPYRMSDVLALIDDMIGQLNPKHERFHLRSLKGRLEAIIHDPRYGFMFGKMTIEDNLDHLIGRIFRIPHEGLPITIFQLAGLPSEVLNAVASILSRLAFDLAAYSEGHYEILLLCEEAHRYVPHDSAAGFAPTRQSIARIAKEGRKYGCYLGIVTQRPGELDPTILSQCSTVFAMRLANDRDQEIIRSAIADSSASTISFLSSIGNREAIAFGEAVATTMRMKFQSLHHSILPHMLSEEPDFGNVPSDNEHLVNVVNRMRMINGSDLR